MKVTWGVRTVFKGICLIHLLSIGEVQASSLLARANKHYDRGAYHEALSLYRKAVVSGENAALAYFNIANSYFQLDSIAQSIVYYRAVTDVAPDFFRGYLNLAISLYTLDDVGGSIAASTRALEIEPGNSKARMIQAAALRKAGAYPEAITVFERILAENSGNTDLYIALGEMFRDLGDDSAALSYFGQYPESGEHGVYALSSMADIVETGGAVEQQLYYLEKLRKKDPENRWTWYRICMVHKQAGNNLLAFEEAKKALLNFPDFGEMALFAGNGALTLGQLGEANRYYGMAKKADTPGASAGLDNVEKFRTVQAY